MPASRSTGRRAAFAATLALSLIAAGPATAEECTNAKYRTGASAALPDCRAYEQVSAVDKRGIGVWTNLPSLGFSQAMPGWAADHGDRILFNTAGGPGHPDPQRGIAFPQVAERVEGVGWRARTLVQNPRPDLIMNAANAAFQHQVPSRDRTALLFKGQAWFGEGQPSGTDQAQLFNASIHLVNPDGSIGWVSRPSTAHPDPMPGTDASLTSQAFTPVALSDDRSTAYFMTRQLLTPQDLTSGRAWHPDWDQGRWALYRVKDGVLSNAGILPDGALDPEGSVAAGVDIGTFSTSPDSSNLTQVLGNGNGVSRNGDRALFVGQGARVIEGRTAQLYMFRDNAETLLLSKRTAGSAPVPGSLGIAPVGAYSGLNSDTHDPVFGFGFALMTATGDEDLGAVLFATPDQLTDDAPESGTRINTYRYTTPAGSSVAGQLEYLADLDRPMPPPGGSVRNSPGNVYRMSDDGSRILFWTPDGELKLWREGASTLTLAEGLETSGNVSTRAVRFSRDARTVVFMSSSAIRGEPNHPPGDGDAQTQIYRFDEATDDVARCVSCPPPSAANSGPATFDLLTPVSSGFGAQSGQNLVAAQARGISEDGTKVFFTTTSTIDPRDQNSAADVYEWNALEGSPVLLSSGRAGSLGEGLLDVDASGDNVFFVSSEALTASDSDDVADLYVARRDGGLPDPEPEDDELFCPLPNDCQSPRPEESPLLNPASGTTGAPSAGGPHDGVPAAVRKFGVRHSRSSSTKATVSVSAPAAGMIKVEGTGVRTASRRVAAAGTYVMHARLSSRSIRRLAKSGRVRVVIRVRLTAAAGTSQVATVKVTIRRTTSTSRRGR